MGLQIPAWTDAPWREVDLAPSGLFLAESPIAFRHRRIFTQAEPLRRARMPRQDVGDPSD